MEEVSIPMMMKGGKLEERPKFEPKGYLQRQRTNGNPLPREGRTVVLKLHCSCCSSKVKDTIDVRVLYSRYKTGSSQTRSYYELYRVKSLFIMAWIQAPYIHVILADIMSIT